MDKYNPVNNFLPFDSRDKVVNKTTVDKSTVVNTNPNDRTYQMPVTTSYPDTTAFAKFLFPNTSACRDTGYLCVSNADATVNTDRLAYYPTESQYYSPSYSKPSNNIGYQTIKSKPSN